MSWALTSARVGNWQTRGLSLEGGREHSRGGDDLDLFFRVLASRAQLTSAFALYRLCAFAAAFMR